MLPHTPSTGNLFQQQAAAQDRPQQQIIPTNSPLVYQGGRTTPGTATNTATTNATTTLADELASADGNQPHMHGGAHKPKNAATAAYTLNGGDRQNGCELPPASNQNYYGCESTPVSSKRRPLKDILAGVLNDSRSGHFGEDSDRKDNLMKKSGFKKFVAQSFY